ncbi:hypothetical protein HanRHA438_Chr01g0008721 [Helianthus annuus]|nr:hypothetical protein HanHA89_Chr01g0007601 [Helianthus annuus]KAJ0782321.1 hypothetical protein HanLR1_Chr01g0006751 [Helianthus annuus]KAJ0946869.1 hypothetical protein HanRHA438_Chr01g0008721 [Helianthus annuus]KAJ0955890.1 hypothetical protein HanPSC8_Chr01g0008151 [Helianthus annuus]
MNLILPSLTNHTIRLQRFFTFLIHIHTSIVSASLVNNLSLISRETVRIRRRRSLCSSEEEETSNTHSYGFTIAGAGKFMQFHTVATVLASRLFENTQMHLLGF